MTDQFLLTAEEIYYLAKKNQGKFLDYDYISAMGNVGDNKSVFEEKCKRSLLGKNLMEEDFDGNINMSTKVKDLVEPIYNGDYESLFSYIDGKNSSIIARFHRLDSRYILVIEKSNGFEIRKIEASYIKEFLEESMKKCGNIEYSGEAVDKEKLNIVILIKGIEPEKKSIVNAFYGNANGVFEEQDDGSFKNIKKDAFVNRAVDILKGV